MYNYRMIQHIELVPPVVLKGTDVESLLAEVNSRIDSGATSGATLPEGLHIVTPRGDTSRTHTVHVFSAAEARERSINPNEGAGEYIISPNQVAGRQLEITRRTSRLALSRSKTQLIMIPYGSGVAAVAALKHTPGRSPRS